jgi:hypothetical protein
MFTLTHNCRTSTPQSLGSLTFGSMARQCTMAGALGRGSCSSHDSQETKRKQKRLKYHILLWEYISKDLRLPTRLPSPSNTTKLRTKIWAHSLGGSFQIQAIAAFILGFLFCFVFYEHFIFSFYFFSLFIYSYVHTLFGPFLPPAPHPLSSPSTSPFILSLKAPHYTLGEHGRKTCTEK